MDPANTTAYQLAQLNVQQLAANLNVRGAVVLMFSTALFFLVAGLWRDVLVDFINVYVPRGSAQNSKVKQLAFNFAVSLLISVAAAYLIFLLYRFAASPISFSARKRAGQENASTDA